MRRVLFMIKLFHPHSVYSWMQIADPLRLMLLQQFPTCQREVRPAPQILPWFPNPPKAESSMDRRQNGCASAEYINSGATDDSGYCHCLLFHDGNVPFVNT